MAVDQGANAVAAGDEAFAFQHRQNVPQLGAADAHNGGQLALPGQLGGVGPGAGLHFPDELGVSLLGKNILKFRHRESSKY